MEVDGRDDLDLVRFFKDSVMVLSDSKMFLHLMIVWLVSVVFCWKIFPMFHSRKKKETLGDDNTSGNVRKQSTSDEVSDIEDDNLLATSTKVNLDQSSFSPPAMMSPPSLPMKKSTKSSRLSSAASAASSPKLPSRKSSAAPSPTLPSPLNASRTKSPKKDFLSQLELEVCGKAKEAGKHPSYTSLVLTLVHNYNLDINKTVLSNNYTIFHCACLSCNLELVSSLSPLADLGVVTGQGDSPLYLAVYAASHRLRSLPGSCQDGLEIIKHLVSLGCDVNKSNLAGWTPLHQASRLGHQKMVRLLLDSGAEMRSGRDTSMMNTTTNIMNSTTNIMNSSIISRCSSVVTRSMSKREKAEVEGLDKSFVNRVV